MLIVDNTFLTPVLSRPLDLGADVVIHSGTKYIAGHNDALVGLIVAKGQELCDRIAYIQNGAGAVLSPFDSWLTIRGMKTLSLRMKRHQENAQAIAEFLKLNHKWNRCFIRIKVGCCLSVCKMKLGLIHF